MVSGSLLIEQFLNGVTIGIVYVLIAAGLSIIFGVMDVVNFAHGELFALGAYFSLSIAMPFGGSGFWVGLVVAPVLIGVLGMTIERYTLRPLYNRNPLYQILLTFGLVLILADLLVLVWGSAPRSFSTPAVLNQPIALGPIEYSRYSFFIIGLGSALAISVWWALNNTRAGLIIRAGAQDRTMIRNLGIDIDRYYTLVFGAGAALAGIAGVVLGGYQSVSPTMGQSVIIPAFVIVVLGGLGSFRGAVLGGLFVGIVQTFTRTFVPSLEGIIVYTLMIAVLLVRPSGLFGDPMWQSHDEDDSGLSTTRQGAGLTDTQRLWIGLAVVIFLAVLPLGVGVLYSQFAVSLATDILIWALFALSLDFILGYTGLVSLGHAMFYGIGAYASMLVMLHLSTSVFVALVVGVILSAALALFVGYLSIRVSGIYFAMITLGFAQLLYNLIFKFGWTGGSQGLFGVTPLLGIAGVGIDFGSVDFGPLTGEILLYYFLLVTVLLSYLFLRRVMQSPFGSVMVSIRESETRSRFVGYDVTTHKQHAFAISGALAGLAGGLATVSQGFVSPDVMYWLRSGEVVVMVVLGGLGTLYGPMIGAGVFVTFQDILSSYIQQWRLVLGIIFVVFVIYVPHGLTSMVSRLGLHISSIEEEPTNSSQSGGD